MSWRAAAALLLLVLLYVRSPIDLVPDRFGAFGLLDDLLVLIATIWWLRRQRGTRGRRDAGAARPEAWDPYAVLGVPRDASPQEITHAYREQIKRYHPDRVADLGEELRQVAHRRTLDIQRAYAEIGRR
jgi:DnaJ-domain-containing protein 1